MLAIVPPLPEAEPERAITVPSSIEDLRSVADAFLSTGWTLAAAVWAWTYDAGRGRPAKMLNSEHLSIAEFARLGIRGLSSRNTVAKYRAIWQSAIDAGLATAVEPGETVAQPDA